MTGPTNRRFSTMPAPAQNPMAPMEIPQPTHTPVQPPRPQSSGRSFAQQLYASSGNKMAAPVISNHHITNLSTSVDAPHPHRVSSLPILPPPAPPGAGWPNYYSNVSLSPPGPQKDNFPPSSNNLQVGTVRPLGADISANFGANLNSASSANGTSASASVNTGFGANVHLPQRIQPSPQLHTPPTLPLPLSQAHGQSHNLYGRPHHGHGFAHQYHSLTHHAHAQLQQHHTSNSHPTNTNNGPRPTPHLLTVTRPPADVNQPPSILQPTPTPAGQIVASPTLLSPLPISGHISPSSVSSASPPAHSLLFSQSPASNMTSPGLVFSPTSNDVSPISVTFPNGAPGANRPPSSAATGGTIAAQAAMTIGGAILSATTGIPARMVSRVGSLLTDKRLIAMLKSAFSKNNSGVAESDLQAVLQGQPEANYQAILNALIRQQQLEQQQLMIQIQAQTQTGMQYQRPPQSTIDYAVLIAEIEKMQKMAQKAQAEAMATQQAAAAQQQALAQLQVNALQGQQHQHVAQAQALVQPSQYQTHQQLVQNLTQQQHQMSAQQQALTQFAQQQEQANAQKLHALALQQQQVGQANAQMLQQQQHEQANTEMMQALEQKYQQQLAAQQQALAQQQAQAQQQQQALAQQIAHQQQLFQQANAQKLQELQQQQQQSATQQQATYNNLLHQQQAAQQQNSMLQQQLNQHRPPGNSAHSYLHSFNQLVQQTQQQQTQQQQSTQQPGVMNMLNSALGGDAGQPPSFDPTSLFSSGTDGGGGLGAGNFLGDLAQGLMTNAPADPTQDTSGLSGFVSGFASALSSGGSGDVSSFTAGFDLGSITDSFSQS